MWPPTNGRELTQGHEGKRHAPYYDQFGYPTCGIGHKLSNVKNEPLSDFPMASDDQIDAWFVDDYDVKAQDECRRIFGDAWEGFGDARQAAFMDMAFELGEAGLGKFHDMIVAVEAGDWAEAAAQAKNSLWDRQVPHRAAHDEALIATGDWNSLREIQNA